MTSVAAATTTVVALLVLLFIDYCNSLYSWFVIAGRVSLSSFLWRWWFPDAGSATAVGRGGEVHMLRVTLGNGGFLFVVVVLVVVECRRALSAETCARDEAWACARGAAEISKSTVLQPDAAC